MVNLTNLKKSRSANRNAANGLVAKADKKLKEDFSDGVRKYI